MSILRLTLLLLLLSPALSRGEEFIFELYSLTDGARQSITQGTVTYTITDPVVSVSRRGGNEAVHRELRFAPGFAVGVTDYGEKSPEGFGCWLVRRASSISLDQYDGFSWEWYDRGGGSPYSKRRGNGRASVLVQPSGTRSAIARIEFLTDTVFQMNAAPRGKPVEYTHELVIKAGSVLAFPAAFPK